MGPCPTPFNGKNLDVRTLFITTSFKQMTNLLVGLLCLVGISGCTKEEPVELHMQDLRGSNDSPILTSVAELEAETFIKKYNLRALNAEMATTAVKDLSNPMESRVMAMAATLLDTDLMQESVFNIPTTQDSFGLMHEGLVEALKREGSRDEALKFIRKYTKRMFTGCSDELKGCKYTAFFKRVGASKLIVMAEIHYRPDQSRCSMPLDDYYRYLDMAYAVMNSGHDFARNDVYYLECSLPRLNQLGIAAEAETQGVTGAVRATIVSLGVGRLKAEEAIALFADKLENIIVHSSDSISSTEDLKGTMERFREGLRPLEYNFGSIPATKVGFVLKRLRRADLIEMSRAGVLSDPDFRKGLTAAIRKSTSTYQYEKIQEFLKENTPDLERMLGVKKAHTGEPTFVLLNAVATRLWDAQLALSFADGRMGEEELERAKNNVDAIAKNIFLRQLVISNQMMADFYQNETFRREETIWRALAKGKEIAEQWEEVFTRISSLTDFAAGALDLKSADIKRMGIDKKGITIATDYLLAFPHTMMLAYQLAQKQFEITFETWWGRITFDYKVLYNYIFENAISAWFNYAPGSKAFDKERSFSVHQKVQAVYFALMTDAFRTMGVPAEMFLKESYKQLLEKYTNLMRSGYENILKARSDFASQYSASAIVCAEERTRAQHLEQGLSPYRVKYSQTIQLIDKNVGGNIGIGIHNGLLSRKEWFRMLLGGDPLLTNYVSLGDDSLIDGDDIRLFNWDENEQERLDHLRVGVSRLKRYLGGMVKAYERYRQLRGTVEVFAQDGPDGDGVWIERKANSPEELTADIERAVKNIKSSEREYNHQQRRYLTKLTRVNKELGIDCGVYLIEHELDLHRELHQKAIDHLRSVYRDKRKLQDFVGGPPGQYAAAYEKVAGKYRFDDMKVGDYTGFNHFEGDGYFYSKTDATFRVVRFLKEIAPEITVVMPTAQEFMDNHLSTIAIMDTTIPFFHKNGSWLTEDDFVQRGITQHNTRRGYSNDSSFFFWDHQLYDYAAKRYIKEIVPFMMSMYRIGKVDLYENELSICLADKIPDEKICPVVNKKLIDAPTLIRENLMVLQQVSVSYNDESLFKMMAMNARNDMVTTYSTGSLIYDPMRIILLINPENGNHVPFLAGAYRYLTETELLGKATKMAWDHGLVCVQRCSWEPNRTSLKVELQSYYDAQKGLKRALFKIQKDAQGSLDEDYITLYKNQKLYESEFRAAATAQENLDYENHQYMSDFMGLNPPNFRYLPRSTRYSMAYDRDVDIYMESSKIRDYERKVKKFEQDTKCYFDKSSKACDNMSMADDESE